MGNEVNEVINNICEKLGYAAKEITPEMAHYMIARCFVVLGACLIGLIIVVIICLLTVRIYGNAKRRYFKEYEIWDERNGSWSCRPKRPDIVDDGYIFGLASAGIIFLTSSIVALERGIELAGWLASPKAAMVAWVLSQIQ